MAKKETKQKDGEQLVFAKDMMTVYGTGNGHMEKGKAYEVHKLHGERLIASGAASAEQLDK